MQLLPIGFDIVHSQMTRVAGAKTARVTGAKEDLPVKGFCGIDQLPCLFRQQYLGQCTNSWDPYGTQGRPIPWNCLSKKEFDRSDQRPHRAEFEVLLSLQDILPDLIFGKQIGWLPIVLSQQRHLVQIEVDGPRRTSLQIQLFTEEFRVRRMKTRLLC